MNPFSQFEKELKSLSRVTRKFNIDSLPQTSQVNEELERVILRTLKKVNKLSDLPREISRIKELKQYESFHFITHERGEALSHCYSYRSCGETQQRKFQVKDFNLIFSTIKKSKNKLFNAQSLKTKLFPLVGYFLASALNTQKVNILLVVSRDGFLPPENEELEFFDIFSQLLPQKIENLFLQKKMSDKSFALKSMLNTMPFGLIVRDSLGTTVLGKKNEQDTSFKKILFSQGQIEIYAQNHQNEGNFYHDERLELLGELLNTLRHELSNPLFGLKLASNLLQTFKQDEEDQSFIKHIQTSSHRCEEIIESFSRFYKDHPQQSFNNIEEIVEEVFVLSKSETKHFSPSFTNNTELEKVYANPTWLVQILFNFIVNSAQSLSELTSYSRDSYINVHVDQLKTGYLSISVTDNGRGITSDENEKVLKPFFTTKSDGTGIGLSISRHLCEKMNGQITFKSPGRDLGATFTIHLPLKQ